MTVKCDEHESLRDNVRKLEGNTLAIAITSNETAKAVEIIKTNHLPHLQAGQDRAERRLDKLAEAVAVLKKLINWLLALVGIGVAIVGVGVALIGILQVME